MRIHETVRVEAKPAPKKEENDKLVKVRARVTFKTKRQFRTHVPNKGWKKTRYSSLFVDFLAWKRNDGSVPGWVDYVKAGQTLNVEGQIYQTQSDKGKNFTNIEIDSISFPIGIDDDQSNGNSGSTPKAQPQAQPVAAAAAPAIGDDEEIPF